MPKFYTPDYLLVQKVFWYDLKLSHNTCMTDRWTKRQTTTHTIAWPLRYNVHLKRDDDDGVHRLFCHGQQNTSINLYCMS